MTFAKIFHELPKDRFDADLLYVRRSERDRHSFKPAAAEAECSLACRPVRVPLRVHHLAADFTQGAVTERLEYRVNIGTPPQTAIAGEKIC